MAEHVAVSVQDRILTIRMNRPEKKNAVTQEMYRIMMEALRQAQADAAVRVVLITGSEQCFTAGNDLEDFLKAKPGETSHALLFLEALATAQKPMVAAVSGVAVGLGTTMLLHCDLVYASSTARFQLPFVNLGISPEAGSSYILPAMVGQRRAAELLLLGDPFSAETARDLGIVNEVLPEGEVLSRATARAQQLAEKPPAALRNARALMKKGSEAAIAEAMARELKEFGPLLVGPEAKEAFTAFLQRRKPDFSRF
ncbi:MAG TPA: enoyl-CoA hydratase [Candidatus Sulfotelmatobacter sp.]|nr:enoyl-CoA hydratase [Candidatus Sulfotelmatobacter sp.]